MGLVFIMQLQSLICTLDLCAMGWAGLEAKAEVRGDRGLRARSIPPPADGGARRTGSEGLTTVCGAGGAALGGDGGRAAWAETGEGKTDPAALSCLKPRDTALRSSSD